MIEGLLLVLKPAGMTSHDVVQWVRRWSGLRRVGHTGTLDPMAEGLLPVLLGRATRLSEYMMDLVKGYRAEVSFGIGTDTHDGWGQPLDVATGPQPKEEQVRAALRQLVGEQLQVPPMTSARRHDGQRLYKLAHQGKTVEREARRIMIYGLELVGFEAGVPTGARAVIDVQCSAGTYVRTLCATLGRVLDSAAYMSYLLRFQIGPFSVNSALTLEELQQLPAPTQVLISLRDSLSWLPELWLTKTQVERVSHGALPGDLDLSESAPGLVRLCSPDGSLAAVGRLVAGQEGSPTVQLEKVFAT